MAIEPGPQRAGDGQPAERADQEAGEVFPARRGEADLLQDIELLAARVVEHPLVPAVVDRLPGRAQARDQLRADRVERPGDEARLRREPAAAADAVGRDGAGRIGANPADARLPELGPGVRRALPDDVVAVDGGQVRALVAGDDARRHAGGAHHDDEGGGEVLAEAFLAIEPELVDGVAAVVARSERVAVALRADVLQQVLRELRCASRRAAPDRRERLRAQASVRGLNPAGSSRLSSSSPPRRAVPSTKRVLALALMRTRSAIGLSASHCRSSRATMR